MHSVYICDIIFSFYNCILFIDCYIQLSFLILLVVFVALVWFLYLRRSSKNRRKADRKKYSLKEGSPHEELALMEALGGLVKTIDELRGKAWEL